MSLRLLSLHLLHELDDANNLSTISSLLLFNSDPKSNEATTIAVSMKVQTSTPELSNINLKSSISILFLSLPQDQTSILEKFNKVLIFISLYLYDLPKI
jgi:hypothetical protein